MNEELILILEQLKNNFSYGEISDYENLLLIIYNSLFLDEDNLSSIIKYKIFETLSTFINIIQMHKDNEINKINKEENLALLEKVFIPFYMRDNNIRPRYRLLNSLVYKTKERP